MTAENIIKIVLGIVLLLYGFKFKKITLALLWFAICYQLVTQYGPNFISDNTLLLVLAIGLGFVGAAFSITLEKIAISIVAFLIGFYAIYNVGTSIFYIIGGIVLGLILAFLARKFLKIIIIIITSYMGAVLISPLIISYLTAMNSNTLIILATVVGIVYQLYDNQYFALNGDRRG